MKSIFTLFAILISLHMSAQLTLGFNFNPSNDGNLCSVAHDDSYLYVYQCFAAVINKYDKTTGTFMSSIPFPQASGANDVDIEIVTTEFVMNATNIPAGSLLVFDGESGAVEIYAISVSDGTVITTLNTNFGNSHVVGGDFNATNSNFYVVQDKLASATERNKVVELDNINGSNTFSFQTSDDGFIVNYGDLSCYNNQLFVVSSDEADMAVYSITGDLQQLVTLPTEFSSYRSVSIQDGTGEMWVCTSSQVISFEGLNEALSINELAVEDSFSIAPNVVTNTLQVHHLKQPTFYQLYDVLGKQVGKGNIHPQQPIDVSNLSPGLHLLMLDNKTVLKFIKQ
ncbi:T9SS type A sorting domain-containing protein [Subsaxibacter sp. CAU 1640]|uniref:T9SS type A sorting domain-containing protein n=1 Tax=Subsaxibacter sp. CAU 1640 TaxID=2933271 RepID=UPI002005214E|nr:T9SS type A sorting domain-containing protein [Subsaxibacter sp. CAU 1640]MCK7590591.1 T9SS type A sorting domain-containing protein [Subsaxibacter sp. CAU 1640]